MASVFFCTAPDIHFPKSLTLAALNLIDGVKLTETCLTLPGVLRLKVCIPHIAINYFLSYEVFFPMDKAQ